MPNVSKESLRPLRFTKYGINNGPVTYIHGALGAPEDCACNRGQTSVFELTLLEARTSAMAEAATDSNSAKGDIIGKLKRPSVQTTVMSVFHPSGRTRA